MSRSARWYRRLLWLSPGRLRREYADDMVAAFDAMLADARRRDLRFPRTRVWLRALVDLSVATVQSWRPGPNGPSPGPRNLMTSRLQDLRFALRVIRRQPLFALVTILTIAVGVGATTTIFAVANGMLLRVPDGLRTADRLVTLHTLGEDGSSFHAFSIPEYRHLASVDGPVEELAAHDNFTGSLVLDGVPYPLAGDIVSGNYFETLGTRVAAGRLFHADEDTFPGRDRVAVISHRLWQERFDGDPATVGREIRLNGRSFTVVGVTEPGFQGHTAAVRTDVWVPLSAQGLIRGATDLSEEEASAGLETVGRLAPEATPEVAREVLDTAAAAFHERRGSEWYGIDVIGYMPTTPVAREGLSIFLVGMFLIAAVLLAITAVNVANMMLSRGASRSREIGVRLALGASRSRVVAQLLTETVILFLGGGLVGVLLTIWSTGLLASIELPIPLPLDLNFAPDLRVLAFALAVAGVSAVIFGLSPALHATRGNLVGALKEGGDAPAGRQRLRRGLVVVQVAGSALLLVMAGLLVRSLGQVSSLDMGMDTRGVYAFTLDTTEANRSAEESVRFFGQLVESVELIRGVESVGAIDVPPLSGSNQQALVLLPDRPEVPGDGLRQVEFARVSPEYFDTMRIPLRAGRTFGPDDERGAPVAVVVNRHLVESFWPGDDPLGKQIAFRTADEPIAATVVGVTANSKIRTPGDPDRPLVYVSWEQWRSRDYTLVARLQSPDVAAAVRDRIRELDPVLPPARPVAYTELVGLSLLPLRVASLLATVFGGAGLLLAAIGLYGLLAYSVTRRSREIGVRMALGAPKTGVQRMVVSSALRLTAVGLVVGLVAAAGLGRLIEWLLFGISPVDPLTFGGIAAILLLIAGAAAWIPARRAATIDPVDALRSE